jgi:CheY-like chemotaxis protein
MPYLALVIDDDAPSRMFLRLTLENSGLDVVEADNGAAAVALLEQHTPDLLVLDLLLPQVNGLEIVKLVDETPRLARTQVIILSAHDQYRHLIRASHQYLVKPISAARLREAVQEAVRGLG